MNTQTLNILDTVTNAVMLLVMVLPCYMLLLSHVIGDMPIIRSPLAKVVINGRMRIITLRNPWTSKWITTISLSYTPAITPQPLASPVAAFSNPYRFAMGLVVILLLSACGPTSPSNEGDKVSTQYVKDGYSLNKACWWATPTGDSLKVEGHKYTISERSRYRVARLDRALVDNLLKGDVWVNDWAFYSDTKRDDTVYVFNRCDYDADALGGN